MLSFRESESFPGSSDSKESACNAGHLLFEVGKIPWRREWLLPTPIFLPGEFQGMRRFVGYSPWGCKELDMTEWLTLSFLLFLFIAREAKPPHKWNVSRIFKYNLTTLTNGQQKKQVLVPHGELPALFIPQTMYHLYYGWYEEFFRIILSKNAWCPTLWY